MSPPSGTRDEYSRKDGASRRGRGAVAVPSRGAFQAPDAAVPKRRRRRPLAFPSGLRTTIVLGAVLGAALLVVSEFITLYSVRASGHPGTVETIQGGSNNSYAMIPIAVLGLVLAVAAIRGGGRPALAGLGLVGLVGLLISLIGDLPAAHRTGPILVARHLLLGASSPSTGMYLETAGAVVLIATAGLGLLLSEPAPGTGEE
jgi:hypothetical protein